MLRFALNHMTLANQSYSELLSSSNRLGCCGIEVRNDLPGDMLGGANPANARDLAREQNQEIFAVAEVASFDCCNEAMLSRARALIHTAAALGAKGVALIPDNSGSNTDSVKNKANLRKAIRELKPLLNEAKLIGFIEPLGFTTASLRFKSATLEAIDAEGALDSFQLVHDTFHHTVSGETEIFAEHTGIVHISGVAKSQLTPAQLLDEHRVLVNEQDCLNTIEQLYVLQSAGYQGPVSFEVFAPQIHELADPVLAIHESMEFIMSTAAANAA